ncbi:helix-turn-helix transcriptional regulator [Polaribacter sp. Z014]|uniref:tetratricopeptide repeat protein n=1 Tax=Polaribacter sp. Z014 TaxID=2927126 RepID=UPI002020D462|nr:helix-turn-helix transcriptional regulator [Polaribacter sp. Z014]MCL7762964.1 helix-turn-helix transcriptional regulator [Polaribacter sp. Z014]
MNSLGKHILKNNLTKGFYITTLFVLLMFGSLSAQESKEQSVNKLEQYSDSDAQVLENEYTASLKKADTLAAILTLQKLALLYGHQARHKKSYNKLWQALLLADASKMKMLKAFIYRDIGRHYSYYKRKTKALKFLNSSLDLKKELVQNKEIKDEELANAYLAFVATYRELNDLKSAKVYLDSSAVFLKNSTQLRDKTFYSFEYGVILNSEGNYEKALKAFRDCLNWFSKNLPSYRVLINTYVGDVYKNKQEYAKSENSYLEALELSKSYNVHKDFTPLIYERLSDLYLLKGNKDKAFASLKRAKELDYLYFDSRSATNRPLLEIQDEFLEEKNRQITANKEQRLQQLEQEEQVLFLERMLLFVAVVGLILFINNIRSKHKAEKKILRKKREFEIEKNKEVLELKNKELATSVIKLIEKDAFIDQLKEKLSNGKGDINRQEAKQIINSIAVNNLDNWSEFETRFVAINKKFYTKLTKKFPDLTANDQRLCALIKLNFSSKEIAKLLNMSKESVHTTRSRLRKKLKISRDVNLKNFIASI